eukprot:6188085-Pleurochrysis_carterae.AAC.1
MNYQTAWLQQGLASRRMKLDALLVDFLGEPGRSCFEASWMTRYLSFVGFQVNVDDTQYQIGKSCRYVAAQAACFLERAGGGWAAIYQFHLILEGLRDGQQ